jgi:ABC-type molybdate transport system permease subunit
VPADPSDRRRRSVRQLLFVIAGSHTGGFLGSVLPETGPLALPGNLSAVLLIAVLFALPFVVDANWEAIDRRYLGLVGEKE